MDIAVLVAKRSTCIRRAVGAVIVKDKQILTTGYNGAPSGLKHCTETGCLRERLNVPSGEQNAIIQAASNGVSIRGATLFCTNFPCSICAKMIINAGIKIVCYQAEYPDTKSEAYLKEANIKLDA
ncbi:cytidine/deoxycytidylate deaminase family protein [Desulfobacterales bacterium HSG2]|nr:cytidine/deoxycytidylate deaminase family protein [Desulfobacterales bacterium HSG2]